jgi:hypothetical protein
MINSEKLTVKAGEALNEAINAARKNGNPVVNDLHCCARSSSRTRALSFPFSRSSART